MWNMKSLPFPQSLNQAKCILLIPGFAIFGLKSINWVTHRNFGEKIARNRASAVEGCCPVLNCAFQVSVADEMENLSSFGQKLILDSDSDFRPFKQYVQLLHCFAIQKSKIQELGFDDHCESFPAQVILWFYEYSPMSDWWNWYGSDW